MQSTAINTAFTTGNVSVMMYPSYNAAVTQTWYQQSRTGHWFTTNDSFTVMPNGEIWSQEYTEDEDGYSCSPLEPTNTFVTNTIEVTHNVGSRVSYLLNALAHEMELYCSHVRDNYNDYISIGHEAMSSYEFDIAWEEAHS